MAINFLASGDSHSHYTVREAVQKRASVRILQSGLYTSGLTTSPAYDTYRYTQAQVYVNTLFVSNTAGIGFQLQGSVDGTNWTALASGTPVSATGLRTYLLPNVTSGYLLPWTRVVVDNQTPVSAGHGVIGTVDIDFFR